MFEEKEVLSDSENLNAMQCNNQGHKENFSLSRERGRKKLAISRWVASGITFQLLSV